MTDVDLSIIIVSFNTRSRTLECLRSVYDQTRDTRFEVIVVDNASSDGSGEAIASEFPKLNLIELEDNIGFARANNLAAERAAGKYLLLLNPDTLVLDGAVQRLHAFAESRGNAGICGGRSIFPDGTLNPLCCRRSPTPWSMFCIATGLSHIFKESRLFNPEAYGAFQQNSVKEVDIIHGSFLLIGSGLWKELGGFDPAFFMYGEEVDLCTRARKKGFPCFYTPGATVIHYGGASEKIFADKMVRLLSAKSTFIRRHWPGRSSWFGISMLWLWVLRRYLFTILSSLFPTHGDRRNVSEMKKIWKHRSNWLVGYR